MDFRIYLWFIIEALTMIVLLVIVLKDPGLVLPRSSGSAEGKYRIRETTATYLLLGLLGLGIFYLVPVVVIWTFHWSGLRHEKGGLMIVDIVIMVFSLLWLALCVLLTLFVRSTWVEYCPRAARLSVKQRG